MRRRWTPEHVYSLGELIDIAESNNPTTQAAWNRAQSTPESIGIAKNDLYPTIIATVSGTTYLNPTLQSDLCPAGPAIFDAELLWLPLSWTSARKAGDHRC
jgi:outer membrane protein